MLTPRCATACSWRLSRHLREVSEKRKIIGKQRNGSDSMYFPSVMAKGRTDVNSRHKNRAGQAFLSILIAMGSGALLSGCGTKEVAEANPTVTVQVDAAEKGAIQRKIVTDAVLYPRDQAAIVPKVVSSVKKWYVD